MSSRRAKNGMNFVSMSNMLLKSHIRTAHSNYRSMEQFTDLDKI